MSTTKGIALLGAGIFAKEAHLPALAALGTSAPPLLAVYSRSRSSAQSLADAAKETLSYLNAPPDVFYDVDAVAGTTNEKTGLDALLARSDISAVLVVLPITLQPEIVRKALKAGKHVLSEKPVAPDVKSGLEIIGEYRKEFQKQGLVWRVAENWEAEPAYRKVGAAIKEGVIGDVKWFKSSVWNFVDASSKWYKTPWRTVPEYQGGFLLDGGVHTAAMIRGMLPVVPTHLTGFAALNKAILAPHDTIHSVLKAVGKDKDGKETTLFTGTSDMTFASPTETRPPGDALIIAGTKGWISVNTTYHNGNPFIRARTVKRVKKGSKETISNGEEDEEEDQEEVIETPGSGVRVEFQAFFGAVENVARGQEAVDNLGDPTHALWDVAFIEAALKSDGRLFDFGKLLSSGQV
jgi:predicted dehydrogenase